MKEIDKQSLDERGREKNKERERERDFRQIQRL
jgi:hypothetical protein